MSSASIPATAYGVASSSSTPTIDDEPRCHRCGRMLARFVARPWRIDCPRCKAQNVAGERPQAPTSADRDVDAV